MSMASSSDLRTTPQTYAHRILKSFFRAGPADGAGAMRVAGSTRQPLGSRHPPAPLQHHLSRPLAKDWLECMRPLPDTLESARFMKVAQPRRHFRCRRRGRCRRRRGARAAPPARRTWLWPRAGCGDGKEHTASLFKRRHITMMPCDMYGGYCVSVACDEPVDWSVDVRKEDCLRIRDVLRRGRCCPDRGCGLKPAEFHPGAKMRGMVSFAAFKMLRTWYLTSWARRSTLSRSSRKSPGADLIENENSSVNISECPD